MRTSEDINAIKNTLGDSKIFADVLSPEKIEFLLTTYYNDNNKIKKATGPTVAQVKEGDGIIDDVIEYLRAEVGDFKIRYAHYFETDTPHIIHNDDAFDYPQCYKAFVLPLHLEYATYSSDPSLIVFDQCYFNGPGKFMNEEDVSEFAVHYNAFVTDYTDVQDKVDDAISDEILEMMPHIKKSWTKGLSVNSILPWRIGDIMMFDSIRLHCASDFRINNISKKIALSIFTEL